MEKAPPKLTNDQLATLFGVGDDTRRALLRALGLPKRRHHAFLERRPLVPQQHAGGFDHAVLEAKVCLEPLRRFILREDWLLEGFECSFF